MEMIDRIYFVDCVKLRGVFRDNLDHFSIMNENRNTNRILINDKHELLIVSFHLTLKFHRIDCLILMNYQAMYHSYIEGTYLVNDKFV
jgi:hypothetical protein